MLSCWRKVGGSDVCRPLGCDILPRKGSFLLRESRLATDPLAEGSVIHPSLTCLLGLLFALMAPRDGVYAEDASCYFLTHFITILF